MDEKKRGEIKKQAKEILDRFASSLEKVKFERKKIKKGVGGFRDEGSGEKGDADFIERMLENAPHKELNHVIAEKKKW